MRALAFGGGIGLSLFLLLSLGPSGAEKGFLRISLDPAPSSIVRIGADKAYIVPAERVLVLKCIGDASGSSLSTIQIAIDGKPVVGARMDGPAPALLGFPVTAKAGQTVTVVETFPTPESLAFASGYLSLP